MSYPSASPLETSGNKYPKVFLIILNRNGKATIKQCLSAVFLSDYPNIETVLVDNGSTDGSLEIIKNFFQKCPLITHQKNVGQAAGFNSGIRLALEKMADYILLLDNRVVLKKETLSQMIFTAETEKEIGIFSPLFSESPFGNIFSPEKRIDWLKIKLQDIVCPSKKIPNTFFKAGLIRAHALLIKKEVFKKVELLDENFFLFDWDTDFCYRARKNGILSGIISPLAPTIIPIETQERNNEFYWEIISRLLFFKKNTPLILKPWVFLAIFAQKFKIKITSFFKPTPFSIIANRAFTDYAKWKKNRFSLL